MSRKPTKKDCVGCRDNFYNGNNEYGIQECWSLESATLEPRFLIHRDLPPPYKGEPLRMVPSCYKKQDFVTVKPDALDERGYWK